MKAEKGNKRGNSLKRNNKIKILFIGTLMVIILAGIIIGIKYDVLISKEQVVETNSSENNDSKENNVSEDEKQTPIVKEETSLTNEVLVDDGNKSDTSIVVEDKESVPLDASTTNDSTNSTTSTEVTTPEPSIEKKNEVIAESKIETITSLSIQVDGGEYSDFERRVVELVNVERANYGLEALNYETSLNGLAQTRARELITNFSHTRPNGTDCFTVFIDAGLGYDALGENLAFGQSTPEEVVTGWMSSETHKGNILSPYLKGIVTWVEKGPNGELYWVQLFTGNKF